MDKGIRDEHGMEPVEHVFSSPVSPQRQGDVTALGSDMQESECYHHLRAMLRKALVQ